MLNINHELNLQNSSLSQLGFIFCQVGHLWAGGCPSISGTEVKCVMNQPHTVTFSNFGHQTHTISTLPHDKCLFGILKFSQPSHRGNTEETREIVAKIICSLTNNHL